MNMEFVKIAPNADIEIGKYPVTNLEYKEFVDATDFMQSGG